MLTMLNYILIALIAHVSESFPPGSIYLLSKKDKGCIHFLAPTVPVRNMKCEKQNMKKCFIYLSGGILPTELSTLI